jgi:hypothetical protein
MVLSEKISLNVCLPMAFMGLFIYEQRRQNFSIQRFGICLLAHVDDKGTGFLLEN